MKLKELRTKLTNYGWAVPVASAFILRLFEITKSSIWHDEGYTMWLLRYDFAGIIERTARDVHPPMYYLISKVWITLFGSTAFSIRFLSLLFSVGIVYLVYKIVAEIWDKKAAFYSSLIVAFSPFMIRFGQEARMYGVVAFFTTLAVYFFVKYLKEKRVVYLPLFTLAMIVAMYTQYYSFFVIISLWLIAAIFTPEFFKFQWIKGIKNQSGVFDYKWWLANIALLVLYAPWFPVAYKQVTRVSGSYWIQPQWITIRTIPGNISQFLTYTHLDAIYSWQGALGKGVYWLIILFLIGSGVYLFSVKEKRKVVASLFVYGYLPMLLVFVVSKLKTPIYQDRYFPFSAIGIFVIWGCTIAIIKNKTARISAAVALLLVLSVGGYFMHADANHQMKQVRDEVVSAKESGDVMLSGSLYTFLDGAYYFGYDNLRLISDGVNGYGETSLFYDQASKYMVNPNDLGSQASRIWIIGRNNEDYISKTQLSNWSVVKKIQRGTVTATLYAR